MNEEPYNVDTAPVAYARRMDLNPASQLGSSLLGGLSPSSLTDALGGVSGSPLKAFSPAHVGATSSRPHPGSGEVDPEKAAIEKAERDGKRWEGEAKNLAAYNADKRERWAGMTDAERAHSLQMNEQLSDAERGRVLAQAKQWNDRSPDVQDKILAQHQGPSALREQTNEYVNESLAAISGQSADERASQAPWLRSIDEITGAPHKSTPADDLQAGHDVQQSSLDM